MNSVWSAGTELPNFEKLNKNISTDVLVIGGGIAGILCLYMLKSAGVNCVLLEGAKICGGVTKNTTAKITSQHGLVYNKLIKQFGLQKAQLYLQANEAALKKYRELCKSMDCDFETKDNIVYSVTDINAIKSEFAALKNLNYSATLETDLPLPFKVAGAIKFKNQAQFNPYKFLKEISRDLCIYENSFVTQLVGTKAITSGGYVTAKKVIVTTHFPFINKHGSYFLKMYQHRSYVIALENARNVDGMYVSSAQTGMSFRNYESLLLVGGGGHRTGTKGGNYRELLDFATKYYPLSKVKYKFATQDCITLDSVPYIGNYSANTENLYVATGFNKWGMTTSMVAATVLCDMVLGNHNRFQEVFSPSRTILRPQLAVNATHATLNILTPSKRRCPHLGCALKWNSAEHSWDCPCHGSRFAADGSVIDNPATGDLKKTHNN